MSIPYRWLNALIDRGWLKVLARAELVVLLALGKHVDKASMETWVYADTVAALTDLAPSTVYHALHALRKHGLITTRREQRQSRRINRTYEVDVHSLVPIEQMPTPTMTVQEPTISQEQAQSGELESVYLPENDETLRPARRSSPRSGQIDRVKEQDLVRSLPQQNGEWTEERVEGSLRRAMLQDGSLDDVTLRFLAGPTGRSEEQLKIILGRLRGDSQPVTDTQASTPEAITEPAL